MIYTHDQVLPKGTHIGVYEIQDTKETTAFDITYRAWNHHLKEQVEILEYFPQKRFEMVVGKSSGTPK